MIYELYLFTILPLKHLLSQGLKDTTNFHECQKTSRTERSAVSKHRWNWLRFQRYLMNFYGNFMGILQNTLLETHGQSRFFYLGKRSKTDCEFPTMYKIIWEINSSTLTICIEVMYFFHHRYFWYFGPKAAIP